MSPAPVRGRPPRDLEAPRDLARGWYVAERSTRVGRRPRPAVVAGTEVVVWRTGDGAAVVMDRFCPRRGPHWSWAGWWTGICDARSTTGGSTGRGPAWPPRPPGACHAAPRPGSTPPGRGSATSGPGGARRPPSTRRRTSRTSARRRRPSRRYRFAFDTNATARRVLENGFDLPHFPVVHGIAGDLRLTWDAEENKHTMGARITTDSIALPGQYESVLGVRTFEELLAAVGRCRRSRHSAGAEAYRGRIGLDEEAPAMAVVVQAMVAPTWAGVVFTAEGPVAGADHLVLVEAVEGLGTRLVDGLVEPSRAAFSRREPHAPAFSNSFGERMGESAGRSGPLRELVRTALAVEEALGGPQDIEWALDDDGLHVLQARPITAAVPHPTHFGDWVSEVPGARWARMSICDSWLSDPLSPLFASTLFPTLIDRWATNWGGPTALRRRSPLIPEPMHGTVNGFAYLRFDFPLSRHPLRTLRLTARWLGFHLSRVERRWRGEVLPALRDGLERARDTPLADLTPVEVLRRIRTVEELSARYWAVIGGLAWHWNTSEWLLEAVLARGGRRTAGLTAGSLLVGGERLAHQADRALERIAAADPAEEEELLREYLERFGHLVYSLDPAEATAIDDPSMLRSVVAGRRDGGEPGTRAPLPGSGGAGDPVRRLGRGPLGRTRLRIYRWAPPLERRTGRGTAPLHAGLAVHAGWISRTRRPAACAPACSTPTTTSST
ncbi:hypothetical protein STENM327S_04601 [Streptomyces tendae]